MWKKDACQQLKIKSSGKIDFFTGFLSVFIVSLIMLVCLKLSYYMIAGAYVEDALAASNLASALIDIEEYGKDHTLRILDPQGAYVIYKEALSINLQLDEDGRSFQRGLLEGPVRIVSYIIYNVKDGLVEIYEMDESGNMQESAQGEAGQIYTPDGVLVESTTIYSRIHFGVKGLGQQYIQAEKEKSVDVKRNEEG